MQKILKTISLYIFLAFISLLSIEIISFAFFSIFRDRFIFSSSENLVLSSSLIPRAKIAFHQNFGWLRYYDTPYGERPRKVDYDGKGLLATFGDSYTHCDQVEHDQTFQHHLSRRFKKNVYNFGVGGFGTDQAFLRFLEDFPKVDTEFVALGLIPENINRIVNVYRKFYYEKTALSIPKPRFTLDKEGKLSLIPNPLKSAEEVIDLTDPNFIRSLGKNDYWYNRDKYPNFGFPYTKILFNKRLWLETMQQKSHNVVDDTDPRPWESLWIDHEAKTLMLTILQTFVNNASTTDAIPIILILPQRSEIFAALNGHSSQAQQVLLDWCNTTNTNCFDGIGAFLARIKTLEEAKSLYSGHLTPKGNRILARELARYLKELM
jgi:hypothetical protein